MTTLSLKPIGRVVWQSLRAGQEELAKVADRCRKSESRSADYGCLAFREGLLPLPQRASC